MESVNSLQTKLLFKDTITKLEITVVTLVFNCGPTIAVMLLSLLLKFCIICVKLQLNMFCMDVITGIP